MRIEVHTKLHKHTDGVFEIEKGIYEVHTNQPPVENRANEDIIRQLADHFHIPRSAISVFSGSTSKKKVFDVRL